MEHDPFLPPEKSPEQKWSFFEETEDDTPEEEPRKKRFFGENEKAVEPETKKQVNVEAEKKDKPKQSVAQTEEFTQMTPEQQKHALAKEYVDNRSQQLQVELENVPEASPEALEIIADLELIDALSQKLDHPEITADDAVEEAYEQIMQRLEDILKEAPEDIEELELEPATEDDQHDDIANKPAPKPLFVRSTPAKKKRHTTGTKQPKSSPTVVTTSGGNPGPTGSLTPSRPEFHSQPLSPEAPASVPEVAKSKAEVRRKRAGNLAVSEALSQMLARRYETEPSDTTETPRPVAIDTPERVVNPIKRSIAEKERRVRQLATSQVVRGPEFSQASSVNRSELPPVSLESIQPISYQERPPLHRPERQISHETQRNLQQASTEDLLQIADKIRVDGTSLRSLYKSNQIDRAGLTKVIKEALRGGDVKTALSKASLSAEARRGRAVETRHDDRTFDDVKGYQQPSEAAKARTDNILAALDAVSVAKNGASTSPFSPTPPDITEQALQQAKSAAKRARIVITATLALAAIGIVAITLFIL